MRNYCIFIGDLFFMGLQLAGAAAHITHIVLYFRWLSGLILAARQID